MRRYGCAESPLILKHQTMPCVSALQDVAAYKRRCEELEKALSRSEATAAAERERAQKFERDATLLREVLYETLLHGGKGASASVQSAAEHLQGDSLYFVSIAFATSQQVH
jgi:hypothetical protein